MHVQATPCVGVDAASPINLQVSTFLAHPWPSIMLAAADLIMRCFSEPQSQWTSVLMIRNARHAHFLASPHLTKAMSKKLRAHTVTDGGIQHAVLHLCYQGCLQVWHQGAHQQRSPCAHPHRCAPPGMRFNRCRKVQCCCTRKAKAVHSRR